MIILGIVLLFVISMFLFEGAGYALGLFLGAIYMILRAILWVLILPFKLVIMAFKKIF